MSQQVSVQAPEGPHVPQLLLRGEELSTHEEHQPPAWSTRTFSYTCIQ